MSLPSTNGPIVFDIIVAFGNLIDRSSLASKAAWSVIKIARYVGSNQRVGVARRKMLKSEQPLPCRFPDVILKVKSMVE